MANFCIKCGSGLDAAGTCTACENKAVASPPPFYGATPVTQQTYPAPSTQYPAYSAPPQQFPTYYAPSMPPQQPAYPMPPQRMSYTTLPQYPAYSMPPQQTPTYNAPLQQSPYYAPLQQPPYSAPTYNAPPVQPQIPMYGVSPASYPGMPYPYYPGAEQKPAKRKKPKYDDSHLPLYGSAEMMEQASCQDKIAAPLELLPQTGIEPIPENPAAIDAQVLTESVDRENE